MSFYDIDKSIFYFLNNSLSSPVLDVIMPWLTMRGYLLVLPILALMLVRAFRSHNNERREDIIWFLKVVVVGVVSFLFADWVSNELKYLFSRVRPCRALQDVNLLVGCSKSGSMPSNHAANSFAYGFALFYFMKNRFSHALRLWPLAVACLVALSRPYVGVHYPSDIMAGTMVGIFSSICVIYVCNSITSAVGYRNYRKILFLSLLVLSLFRIYYILHGPLDLSPDEAHYWQWSKHPDLSYYSKGPMIAYLIYLGTSVFGDSVFGIRIMAVIFSALSSFFLYQLVLCMYEKKAHAPQHSQRMALFAALLLQALPMFAPFGVIFTIDSPFIFFWILALFFSWRVFRDQDSDAGQKRDWIMLGIVIGLGLLTKYTMAFFMFSLFCFMLFTKHRRTLATAGPYLAAVTSLLVFSPVVVWNYLNGWVTFRHTAGQAHISDGFAINAKTFFDFIGSQIGLITPVIIAAGIYAMYKLMEKRKEDEEEIQTMFIFWFFAPVVLFFVLKSVQAKVQPNWAMTGYITMLIAFARCFGLPDISRVKKIVAASGIALAILVTVIAHYPALVKPVYNLPLKMDPSARLRGWKQLGQYLNPLYAELSKDSHAVVFSDKYQIAGELSFYIKGHPKSFNINLGRRMNQYDLWPDLNEEKKKLLIQGDNRAVNAIFVSDNRSELPKQVTDAFERCDKQEFRALESGQVLRNYTVGICYNFKNIEIYDPKTY